MALEFATRASKGARSYQEDSAVVRTVPEGRGAAAAGPTGSTEQLTAVLADGMGGHAGGALASSTACQIFMRAYDKGVEARIAWRRPCGWRRRR